MPEGMPSIAGGGASRNPVQLLEEVSRYIEAEHRAMQQKKSEWEDLRQKRSQYLEGADALGYTSDALRALQTQIRDHQKKLLESQSLHAELMEHVARLQTMAHPQAELEPEPQPELEPELQPESSIRAQITALRQELARKEEDLEWCKLSARLTEQWRVPPLTAEVEATRKRLQSLGFRDPQDEPQWCTDANERARLRLPLRVLSLDGGGNKGLVQTIVLEQIEDLCGPHKIHELFDLVVGTSTGGIIALGTCAAKIPVRVMTNVYENRADEIWRKAGSRVSKALASSLGPAGQAISFQESAYDPSGLEAILKEKTSTPAQSAESAGASAAAHTVPNARELGEREQPEQERQLLPLLNPDKTAYPKVCVVASQENHRGYTKLMFRTYQPEVERDRGIYSGDMWEAGRATSAAPSFFPAHVLADGRRCVDGGIVANNPVKLAMEEAADIGSGRPVGLLVSLGCGRPVHYERQGAENNGDRGGSGLLSVAKNVKATMTDTQTAHEDVIGQLIGTNMNVGADPGTKSDQLRHTWTSSLSAETLKYGGLANRPRDPAYADCLYVRLNPPMPRSVKMDTADPADLALLRRATEEFLSDPQTTRRLEQMCERLRAHSARPPAVQAQPSAPSTAAVYGHTLAPISSSEELVVMAVPVQPEPMQQRDMPVYSEPAVGLSTTDQVALQQGLQRLAEAHGHREAGSRALQESQIGKGPHGAELQWVHRETAALEHAISLLIGVSKRGLAGGLAPPEQQQLERQLTAAIGRLEELKHQ